MASGNMPAGKVTDQPGTQPQHVVSAELRRKLQQLFERARQLGARGEREYAHSMLAECVVRDPGNLVYVEAMLDNLQHHFESPKKAGRIKGSGLRGFRKAAARGDWETVIKTGTSLIQSNPWDPAVLREMARACAEYGYEEAELRYLRNALVPNPNDVDVNRHCAESLARQGHFNQAIACWNRIAEAQPKNPEAKEMISQLSVEQARVVASGSRRGRSGRSKSQQTPAEDAGGNSGKQAQGDQAAADSRKPSASAATGDDASTEDSSSTDLGLDSGIASSGALVSDTAPLEVYADDDFEVNIVPSKPSPESLRNAISEDPADVENYLELAALYVEGRELDQAEEVLQEALQVSAGSMQVRERLEDVSILQARRQLAVATKRHELKQSEESSLLAQRLREALNRLELDIYGRRSQRYPQQVGLRFQLGVRLKRAGNFAEAAKTLEQAADHNRYRVRASIELGECLQHLKRFEKALEQYRTAAEHAEHKEHRKLALYRAGVLATGLGKWELADRYLQELRRLDPHYRDIERRLDKLDRIRDKG